MSKHLPETIPLASDIYRGLLFTVISLIIIAVGWYVLDILLLSFAAVLFAIFLRTLSDFLKSIHYLHHIPDNAALTIVLIFLIAMSTAFITSTMPLIGVQISQLSQMLPDAWEKLKTHILYYKNIKIIASLYQDIPFQDLIPQGKSIVLQATNIFSSTFGLIGTALLFFCLGVFFAYDPESYREEFVKLFAPHKRERVYEHLDAITIILRWWLIGKFVSMAIVGALTSLGLFLLGVPLSLTLGLLAALLTFIPNFGPIIATIPACLIAISYGFEKAFYVILLYCVVQIFEGYIVTPLIQRKTISLPPATVLIVQLMMAILMGFLGIILATPLLASLMVFIDKIYESSPQPQIEQ